jgi:hypothetical protein
MYAPSATAQTVPLTLTQQGRLLDSTGAPVDGVQLTFTFSLYTAAAGGTAVWTENQSITPDKGYFSAKVGDVTAFPSTIFDGSKPSLFLGIKIGSDAEMAPRQEITSVPFALLSLNALNATHAANADNATNATHATKADSATTATTATSATNANTVTSIAGNFMSASAGGGAVACPTGFGTIIAGGCVSGTANTYITGFSAGKGGFSCSCSGNCALTSSVMCAK